MSTRISCLGDELGEYVAGSLSPDREWAWSRHLVACRLCSQAVGEERQLRSALAGAPSMPGELQASLLALGRTLAAESPVRPAAPGRDPLRLLAPSAPPCHRSPVRATMVAAAAAGLSAAAAWSLTVAGTGSTGPAVTTVTTTPVSVPTGSVAVTGEPATFRTPARWTTSPPGASLPGLGAESSP
ncbi:MAG: hypothetical protein ACRCY8_03240 [Dermatophilaceae bacterium]